MLVNAEARISLFRALDWAVFADAGDAAPTADRREHWEEKIAAAAR